MYADLWGWFNRYTAQAYINRDPLKQQMPQLYDRGWELLRAEKADEALAAFEEGLGLARRLKEPCWELFFDYWCAEALIFYKVDYEKGLDRAVKVSARAHQERYQHCPVRSRVYFTLMYTYYLLDSVGYEDKIREMATYITTEVPMDEDTEQRVQYIQAGLAFALEDYDACEQETMCYLNMSGGSPHRLSGGYDLLRKVAFAHGQIEQAFDYCYQYEAHARRARLQNSVAYGLLWQAAYAQRLNQSERAEQLHQQGIAHHQRFGLQRLSSFYDAVCDYHELRGNMEEALRLREEQLADLMTIQSIEYRCYTLLQCCRLQGRAGQDITTTLQHAYQHAAQLLKPQRYLEKLQCVETGDYWQYAWQKPSKHD